MQNVSHETPFKHAPTNTPEKRPKHASHMPPNTWYGRGWGGDGSESGREAGGVVGGGRQDRSRGDGSGGGESSSEDSVVAGGGSKDKGVGVSVTRAAVRVAAAKAATVATEKTARVAERAGAGLARVALAARAVAI